MTQFRYSANVDYTVDFPSFETYPTENQFESWPAVLTMDLGFNTKLGHGNLALKLIVAGLKSTFHFCLKP